jgi:protein-S-isoprenylcysteine O-methyltransferase Ste14
MIWNFRFTNDRRSRFCRVIPKSQIVNALFAVSGFCATLPAMNWLTKQEQLVICIVIGLLLTGLAVKYYRASHPATIAGQPAKN